MLSRLVPAVGKWYRNEQGEVFEVVALEEEAGIIEIQHFDGAVEELDIDSWHSQRPTASAEPEDYSGALDKQAAEGLEDADMGRHHDEWSNPLDTIE